MFIVCTQSHVILQFLCIITERKINNTDTTFDGRLRVVYNFGDSDPGAGKNKHARAHEISGKRDAKGALKMGRCRSSYKVFSDLLRKQYTKQQNNGP